MSTSLVQTGVKFPDNTVLTSSIPVGATYVQFPGEDPPNSVFGGSWTAIFDNESVFFRTPGGEASSFGGGIQSDQMQRITGLVDGNWMNRGGDVTSLGALARVDDSAVSARAGAGGGSTRGISFDSANSPNARTSSSTNGETRPQNRTIRVWKRTS